MVLCACPFIKFFSLVEAYLIGVGFYVQAISVWGDAYSLDCSVLEPFGIGGGARGNCPNVVGQLLGDSLQRFLSYNSAHS